MLRWQSACGIAFDIVQTSTILIQQLDRTIRRRLVARPPSNPLGDLDVSHVATSVNHSRNFDSALNRSEEHNVLPYTE
jgi:hypothetical protein